MMQRIFDQSPDRIIQIQNKIHTIAMQFDVSTREYYILREINLSMNSLISSMWEIPAYDWGHNLKPYMLYSPELIEMAKEHGLTIVLNFRASRCPRCKAASEDIIVNQQLIPREVIVIEADYDTTKDLQELYGVTQQTTFVFLDSSGNKIKNVEKLTGIDQLVEELGKI